MLLFFLFWHSCQAAPVKKKLKPKKNQSLLQQLLYRLAMKLRLLLKDLEANGDYVNSKEFPSLIKASLVFDNLGKKMLVIDLRPSAEF